MILKAECCPNSVILRNPILVRIGIRWLLWAEIHFLIKRNILTISPFIPPVVHMVPPHGPRYFHLFVEDEEMVTVVITKRDRDEVL